MNLACSVSLLFQVDQFCERKDLSLPAVTEVAVDEMPEPYISVLVGDHGMRTTLEAFYAERIHIRVIERELEMDPSLNALLHGHPMP